MPNKPGTSSVPSVGRIPVAYFEAVEVRNLRPETIGILRINTPSD